MNNEHEQPAKLSDAVLASKKAMLGELQVAMHRRVAQRRAVRTGGIVAVAAVFSSVVAFTWWSDGGQPMRPTEVATTEQTNVEVAISTPATELPRRGLTMVEPPSEPSGLVVVLTTDTRRVEALMLPAPAAAGSVVEMLDDDDLIAVLNKTGNVYGLMRTGGRSAVMCYTCDGRAIDGKGPLNTEHEHRGGGGV